MSAQPTAQLLDQGLAALGLPLAAARRQKLLDYLALLRKWNKVYSLTAITDPAEMIAQHLLDSLAAFAPIAAATAQRLLDVGSGGGQPGIPFAIARDDWQITLLDSNQKKAAFLRQAVIELQLPHVEVACARVEQWQAAPYDVITARAFASLADFTRLSRPLLAPAGRWAALKGIRPDDEIAQLPACITARVTSLRVPGVEAERCLVWMESTA